MECIDIKNLLLDYLDNKLNIHNKAEFEKHIKECPNCSSELKQFKQLNNKLLNIKSIESSEGFENDFYLKLQNEKGNIINKHFVFDFLKVTYKVAAAILLFVGGTIFGLIIQNQKSDETKLTNLENEVKQLKQHVTFSILNENTASEKIQAINFAYEQKQLEKKSAIALYNTLISDDNSNVRFAAASVLQQFSNDEAIKNRLIHALSFQNDPYVQVTLIKILAEFNNKEADNAIKMFLKQDNLNIDVKDFGQQIITMNKI
ncbi:hypothetical protein ES705_35152 [subsurface metagenome]